jgi:hypothetical protein
LTDPNLLDKSVLFTNPPVRPNEISNADFDKLNMASMIFAKTCWSPRKTSLNNAVKKVARKKPIQMMFSTIDDWVK